jgi:hypothetical protein
MPGHPPRNPNLDRLTELQTLQEPVFRSRVPILGPAIAGLRELWNNVSTKWYVRPLIEQQGAFNQAAVGVLQAQNARIEELDAGIRDQGARVEGQSALVQEQGAQIADLAGQVRKAGASLVEQDREASATIHDHGEMAAQLACLRRVIVELEERVDRLEGAGSTSQGNE